jgi:hypothetical protein
MIKSFFTALRHARMDAELQETITEGNRTRSLLLDDRHRRADVLTQCALRDVPKNVEVELGKDASAEAIIRSVVRI